MNLSPEPWIWISALMSLAIFSFLYRDNPFYRFAEHIFVGAANGWAVTFYWHNVLAPSLFDPLFRQGRLFFIIPLVIGCLYFTRFIPKISWLVRIPIGISLGYSMGTSIPSNVQAFIIKQIQGTLLTSQNFQAWNAGSMGIVWSIILFIGVFCTLAYFFFSREHRGVLGVASRIGVIFIMIGFGAAFGYTVMARISLLIGRLQFILGPWLGIID
ncbi:hypothetical protein AMJ52_02970 [candidate division TA06 bacterium DG_78]|uniref:Uncharacterized protein n=1 Tax=candidate division TA06 bacterium DG_78 TaxID=1703772 RepID=A0A0S7YGM7_UNCT6|nr:MAG: hypothetical protein AMJ52_02970 [candidate division TA06 bacterium DG_78]